MSEDSDDDERSRPALRLVSDQPASAVSIQRGSRSAEYVEESTKWALRVLTANLLRVARGAGKPHEITGQIGRLVEEMELYRHAFGQLPHVQEYEEWLATREPRPEDYSERERHDALETVIRGSLQVTASRIAGQLTQERAGEAEMHSGLFAHHEWRDRVRKEQATLTRASSTRKPKAMRKRKPASALKPS